MSEFKLWLEFEEWEEPFDRSDDTSNAVITFPTGEEYAVNVWTYRVLQREIAERRLKQPSYLVPPDLVVETLDRAAVEAVVHSMIANHELNSDWLTPKEYETP